MNINQLLTKTLITFSSKAFAATGVIIFNLYVSRALGAEFLGQYFIGLSIALGLATLARQGRDNAIIKYLSIYIAEGKTNEQISIWSHSFTRTFIFALIFSIFTYAFLSLIGQYLTFNIQKDMHWFISWMAITLPLLYLISARQKALNSPEKSPYFEPNGILLFTTITLVLIQLSGFEITESLVLITTCIFSTLLLCFHATNRTNKNPYEKSHFAINEMEKTLPDFFAISLTVYINQWGIIILVAAILSTTEAGIFNAALRTAFLVNFILLVMNGVTAAKFAALYQKKNIRELENVCRKSTLIMILIATPIAILLVLFSDTIMRLYGKEFSVGSTSLILLTLAQLINAATGSVAYLLNMTGHQKTQRNITFFFCALNIILTIILGHHYGINGIAASMFISISGQNFTSAFFVKKYIRINPWGLFK